MEEKKKNLEERLNLLMQNQRYYRKVYGFRTEELPTGTRTISCLEEIEKWDRNDLDDFEQKIIKLEAAKKEVDEQIEKNAPLEKRKQAYIRIDHLLLEAIAEKEEGRSEKMKAYLAEREKIKKKFPKV
tara:strand:- start:35 stop:418 length:384 start_codon:yes stop_codon:yes gene_type:complete